MGRRRRRIESLQCYEVCFRAREGLPLVAYHTINMIIGAVLARTQRDHKAHLCHDIWNGSHAHLFLVAQDAEMFTKFLGEVQKKLTDILKRLLGRSHMNIWEGTPMISKVLDLAEAIERISYFYANPAQDNLVDTIEKFPGFSSWNDFRNCTNGDLLSEQCQTFPWIRLPSVPKLDSPILSQEEDLHVVNKLKKENKKSHKLIRQPNLWMRSFHVTDKQRIVEVNQEILKRVTEREKAARVKRKAEGKSVMGVARLTSKEIMTPHRPKKHSRKIFCLTSINELRIAFIAEFKAFCAQCRRCYLSWRAGDFSVEWPPGAFKPPIRPAYNILPAPKVVHLGNI